jgi:beta-galactosidase
MKTLFIDNWCFCKQPLGSSFADAKTLPFALIEMPHDWLIHDVKNLYEDSVGWYKKYFVLTETDLQGSRYSLRFDGVYMDSTVYINGTQAFEWKYGYTTFEFEITPLLTAGTNEILVRVNHQSPNTRWYSGAGIFRNVWLNKTGLSRFVPDGIQVLIDKAEDNKWNVTVNSEVDGGGTVRYTLIDPNGAPVAEFTDEITIDNPEIWDTDSPNLYTLRSDLLLDGILQDSVTQRIGFRELAWDVNTGFSINGRHLKLQGACQHHDMGALGAAVNKQAIRRQFDIMRSMGVNAVRTSHNPPAPELMEVADETGMLILSEAFDMWERPKTECDYGRFFPEWHERDVASWVRRDRNCPSLIMWSIGNEIYDTHADKRGQEVTVMLRDCVLKDDKSHLISIGSNYMGGENAQKCADILKVAGYNYGEKLYIEHHAKYPDWIMYGSEVGSTVSSRGIYHFPLEETILADDDGQCSSLGNSTTAWGAKGLEVCIKDDQNTPFSCGHFIWTGFDYIGEPTPYTTKNSYFGTVDTCGYPKDAYYVYRSQWTDYKTDPMVHIYPYWDFNDGQPIDIRAVSNAPTVEVFVNGESKGKFSQDDHNFIFTVKAKYVPGEIRAVAYD